MIMNCPKTRTPTDNKKNEQNKSIRIGILIESFNCSKSLYETVRELKKSEKVKLFFLLNRNKKNIIHKTKLSTKLKQKYKSLKLAFFNAITNAENKILSFFYKDIKEYNKSCNIKEFTNNNILLINPIFYAAKNLITYSNQDIEKIGSLNLDIIIKGNVCGELEDKIINCPKKGIIYFRHIDSGWRSAGFWEVYLKKASTEFIIQILNRKYNEGIILFKGKIQTKRSYTENRVHLYNTINQYLAQIILKRAFNNPIPLPDQKPYFKKIPSFTHTILYIFKTGSIFFSLITKRLTFKKKENWGVAFTKKSWHNTILKRGIRIKNHKNHSFAEPFVFTNNKKTICYVSDYSYITKKSSVTAIEIIDDKNYKILGPVIEEPFSISFPYIFQYKNKLYMVPATRPANSIPLYKCINFPLKWRYQKNILNNVNSCNTMIFEKNKKWWALTNIAVKGNKDYSYALMAYYADNPLSDSWFAHKSNPLILDSDIAKNGGILEAYTDFPIRIRQRQEFNLCGAALSLAKITELTPSVFKEEKIKNVDPNFFKKIKGCHHLHSNGVYTVYDYLK